MQLPRIIALLVLVVALVADSASAQIGRRFIRPSDFQRAGLEQVWRSFVAMDSSRAEVTGTRLQVVGMGSYEQFLKTSRQVYRVQYEKGSRLFRAYDLGRDGLPIGDAEANRLAEKEVIRLEARGYTPELTSTRVPETVLYIQTSNGTLQAIDAENGKTIWTLQVGRPSFHSFTPDANDKFVATVNGSTLYLLERTTGEEVWSKPIGGNPATGPALSNDLVFATSRRGALEGHWLPADATADETLEQRIPRPTWYFQSDSTVSASLTVANNLLAWPTRSGRVYVANLTEPEVVYRFSTAGAIRNTPTVQVPNERFATASTDGFVYCFDQKSGDLIWEYSAGQPVEGPIAAFGDKVFAITEFGNLHCISAHDAARKWVAGRMRQILSASHDRINVMDQSGRLQVLDIQTGGRMAQIRTEGFDHSVTNTKTDRIFLVSKNGTLLCLRETEASLPVLHQPIPQPPAADEPTTPSADSTGSGSEFEPPADDDLFDPTDDAGDDPFEPPAEGDDPFAPMGDDEDPFAPMGDDEDPFAPTGDDEDPFAPVDNAGDEPTVDEPTVDEPTVDEPTVDEPTVDEPAGDEPMDDEDPFAVD